MSMTPIRDTHYHKKENELCIAWLDNTGPHEMYLQGTEAKIALGYIEAEKDDDGRCEILRQIIRNRRWV